MPPYVIFSVLFCFLGLASLFIAIKLHKKTPLDGEVVLIRSYKDVDGEKRPIIIQQYYYDDGPEAVLHKEYIHMKIVNKLNDGIREEN